MVVTEWGTYTRHGCINKRPVVNYCQLSGCHRISMDKNIRLGVKFRVIIIEACKDNKKFVCTTLNNKAIS